MSMDLITVDVPIKDRKKGFEDKLIETLNLAVAYSALGTIHVFRLLSDEEL